MTKTLRRAARALCTGAACGLLIPGAVVAAQAGAAAAKKATPAKKKAAKKKTSARPADPKGCVKLRPSKIHLAREVGESRATLRWSPPRTKIPVYGKARKKGAKRKVVGYKYRYYKVYAYRVYRNGQVVGQTTRRSMEMAVKAGATYTFTVRAVTRAGWQSGCRGVLKQEVALLAPGQPANLTAAGLTDSSLQLKWEAGPRGDGTPAGYRVMRDGQPLSQTRALSLDVGNLAPNRSYTFTVQAVDTAGRLSAPSLPLVTTTTPPAQAAGNIQAFLLAGVDQSFKDFQRHYRKIGTIYPTYFECNRATAAIQGKDDPLITNYAKVRGVKVMARYDCQKGSTLHTIFTDPTVRANTISGLIGLVQQYNYDGINLDFEAGYASDRQAYTDFVTDLAAQLHAIGRKLTVDVSPKANDNSPNHPRSGIFDYPALGQVADQIFVMSWGIHWSTSAPGPLSEMGWATQIANYVASMPTKSKFIWGIPFYSMDWPSGGGPSNIATAREYTDTMAVAAANGVTPQFDPVSQESHFSYTSGGVPHEVWFADAASVNARLQLAKSRGIGGVGFWRLGNEDPAIWDLPLMQPGGGF